MMDAASALAEIERLLAIGDPLPAYDAACDPALEELTGGDRIRYRYLRALALARAGATQRSADELASISEAEEGLESGLAEDIAALSGRLYKDRALRTGGEERRGHFAEAASQYTKAFQRFGGVFSGVNAASMWMLADQREMAQQMARQVLVEMGPGPDVTYWNAASRAEAHLVLGESDLAINSLLVANSLIDADVGARASTSRQLRMICDAQGLDSVPLTKILSNRTVMHFCGHRIVSKSNSDAAEIARVESAVRDALDVEHVGHGYGSLAAGADIIVAEAVLSSGAELHAVLPFSVDEFISTSVRPSGDDWVVRFRRCLEAATSVLVTCDSGYAGDDSLYSYASAIAMGRARNLASSLATEAWQLAIWDSQPTQLEAGTAHDVATWCRLPSARTVVIPVGNRRQSFGGGPDPIAGHRRPVRALLFGDIQGFSKLYDEDLGQFIDQVLTTIASVLDRFGKAVIDRNTWGDGLFAAFTDPLSAARCALDLQEAIAQVSTIGAEPSAPRMRISVHAGPVLSRFDPVRTIDTVFGREITRAARIEPRTPPGEVYATSALAALLRLDPKADIVPEYVGRVTTAKDFETIPMYVLRRST